MAALTSTFSSPEDLQEGLNAKSEVNEEDIITCRMFFKILDEAKESSTFVKLQQVIDISDETRSLWVDGLAKFVTDTSKDHPLRPLNFNLLLDGSVEHAPDVMFHLLSSDYPAAYRIPPEMITNLEPDEQDRRAELFALGSMMYEIYEGRPPFDGLTDSEIQARYCQAEFPGVTNLKHPAPIPTSLMILAYCSINFGTDILDFLSQQAEAPAENKLERFCRKAGDHITAHPVLFGLQIAGAVISSAAVVTLPLLGLVGFGTLDPVAGTSAVAWQSSSGAVQAGSLFAWCQIAVMLGTAVNGVIAAGCAGVGVFLGSTAAMLAMGVQMDDEQMDDETNNKFSRMLVDSCRKAVEKEEEVSVSDDAIALE